MGTEEGCHLPPLAWGPPRANGWVSSSQGRDAVWLLGFSSPSFH